MTDAHTAALHKLKSLVVLVSLAVVVSACTTKPKTYSYQTDDERSFSSQDPFAIDNPGNRFLPASDKMLLSGNLFDQHDTHLAALSTSKVISENLFDLAAVQRKGSVFERMMRTASSQIGTPYRSGGCNPNTGFDCSGFTTWVFNRYGIHLPRSSREQYHIGKQVAKNKLRKGDLVFFRSRRGISHVGIYLENGKFIHSASHGKTVTISHLEEDYWRTHYAGGRRVF